MDVKFITQFDVRIYSVEAERSHTINQIRGLIPDSIETTVMLNFTPYTKIKINKIEYLVLDTACELAINDHIIYLHKVSLAYANDREVHDEMPF